MTASPPDLLASPDAVTARLPLFGREGDVRAILDMLAGPHVRLVTLTGPGGVGKTRLAMQIAREARTLFPDGIYVVPLASVREPQRVPSAVSLAISARESGNETEVQAIAEIIGNRRVLLVLDNMEQVVDAGRFLSKFLAASPRLSLLVTSRMPLRLMREIEYPVVSLPAPHKSVADLGKLTASPAVELFVQRARAVRADFEITPENAAAIAEICRRLDGLPLAIELAASRIKVLSPQALLTRLTHSLQVLTGGPRDAPARLQSMRDAIDWSYALLDQEQRRFFRSLGVFVGGFTLDAVGAVAAGDGMWGPGGRATTDTRSTQMVHEMDVLDHISTLVDHSLVVPMPTTGADARFGLLETIREYAFEALSESGELTIARSRHAAWLFAAMEGVTAHFFGPRETEAMDGIERESGNIRTALAWLTEHDPDLAGRLTYNLWYFWGVRGHYREGLEWVHRLDASRSEVRPKTGALLDLAGGFLHWALGQYEPAMARFHAALPVFAELEDEAEVATARFGLGSVHRDEGRLEEARAELTQALESFDRLNQPAWVGFCLSLLGAVARQQGRYEDAIAMLERGIEITKAIGFTGGMSPMVDHLGDIARERGEYTRALDYYRQTIPLWLEQRDPHGAADSLAGFGATLEALGDSEEAARVLAAATAIYEGLGFPRSRFGPAYKDEIIKRLRTALGDDVFDVAWSAGQRLSLEEALTSTLNYVPPEQPEPSTRKPPKAEMSKLGLTAREAEILEHLLEGRSNAEIGEALFISPRTAGTHVANIFGKLGVSSRAAAVAAVLRSQGETAVD